MKEKKDKYMFEWCERCAYLSGCYYQHSLANGSKVEGQQCLFGELDGPMFLEPACGAGPAKDDEGEDSAEAQPR